MWSCPTQLVAESTPDLLTLLHVISPSFLVSTPHFTEIEVCGPFCFNEMIKNVVHVKRIKELKCSRRQVVLTSCTKFTCFTSTEVQILTPCEVCCSEDDTKMHMQLDLRQSFPFPTTRDLVQSVSFSVVLIT